MSISPSRQHIPNVASIAESIATSALQQQPKSGVGWFDCPVFEAGARSEADEAAAEAASMGSSSKGQSRLNDVVQVCPGLLRRAFPL